MTRAIEITNKSNLDGEDYNIIEDGEQVVRLAPGESYTLNSPGTDTTVEFMPVATLSESSVEGLRQFMLQPEFRNLPPNFQQVIRNAVPNKTIHHAIPNG